MLSQNALRLYAVTVFYSSELTNCQLSLSWSWVSGVWDKLWKISEQAFSRVNKEQEKIVDTLE